MDSTLYDALELLQKRSPSGKMPNITVGQKPLAVEAAEHMLEESLRLLLDHRVVGNVKFIPAIVMQDLEHSVEMKPFMRQRYQKVHRQIGYLLDTFLLCTEPSQHYFSAVTVVKDQLAPSFTHGWIDELIWQKLVLKDMLVLDSATWIHVPSTNIIMIRVCYYTWELDSHSYLQVLMQKLEKYPGIQFGWSLDEYGLINSAAAPGDPLLTYKEHSYSPDPLYSLPSSSTIVVFPCLRLTSYGGHKHVRAKYEELRRNLSTRASGPDSADCDVHVERTLDEAYYPGLERKNLQTRNKDQSICHKSIPESEEPDDDSPLLIVPQLWLWRKKSLLLTAYSFTQDLGDVKFVQMKSTTADRPIYIYEVTDERLTLNPLLQMGLLMATCIEYFGQEQLLQGSDVKSPPTLVLYERRVVSVLSGVQDYMQASTRNSINYDEEKKFHHTIADVRSELAMIRHFLTEQQQILGSLLLEHDPSRADKKQKPHVPRDPNLTSEDSLWKTVEKAESKLALYQDTVQKIDGDAERIGASIQDMLNLKRTYASVQDSHASVLLSTAALGFAIVTIIFTPLAFLTALFALDIQGFDKLRNPTLSAATESAVTMDNQTLVVNVNVTSDDSVYNSAKMGGIFVGTEILTIVLTLLLVWGSLKYVGINIGDMRTAHKESKTPKEENKNTSVSVFARVTAPVAIDSVQKRSPVGKVENV
ncbi:hypothetical protein C7974DRAFT_97919 [Boeremia exigua]|uniref:uncharacterized protein n=1 Tax=Boeremia exigua TaxID=749465 RepID=UPI001E8D0E52|nr:uncharacterized protein C7974DRAFT_97919 [Boeremia exigua]KAH6642245.1 hypothetical protein C7974DRAFT_97919 [Boeremia exigua]